MNKFKLLKNKNTIHKTLMYVSAAEVEISHLMKMTDANSAIK